MVQTRGFRAGSRSGAAAARARLRSLKGGGGGGARGSGTGAGGIITPADYAIKHGEGFGTTQPESLSEGLSNLYGGSAGMVRDKDTGAIVVYDADEDEAVLIEPAGGLSEAERRRVIETVDRQGDMPNIGIVEEGEESPPGAPNVGGWLSEGLFTPTEGDYSEGSYTDASYNSFTEGDYVTTGGNGGGGGGTISKGMLLVIGIALVVAMMLFGRGK